MRLSLSWVELTATDTDNDRPLLLVGPSLGTSVITLWQECAHLLAAHFRVVGWQLPGHGGADPAAGFSVADLAQAVHAGANTLLEQAGHSDEGYYYAGDSLGAAVGLQLALESSDRLGGLVTACSGARIGETGSWQERAAAVRAGGTQVLLEATPARWFGHGFAAREPGRAAALLADLADVDAESYAAACEALAAYDVRSRLAELTVPVLAIAGAQDLTTPPARLRQIADGVVQGELHVLAGVGHLAPAEAPAEVARLIRGLTDRATTSDPAGRSTAQVRADGMRVRREVLGDAHVDRASAGITEFTADFQAFITSYAWGTVWTRSGLDRRSRSMITLTALIARGHHEELAMHIRAAISNGVTENELAELFLQSAIYCGVPDANTAFRIAQRTLAELHAETDSAEDR